MAKNNNLTDFLTDVANAIRAKTGTSGLIDPQDFSSEIASISGGGSVDFTTTNALLDELQTAVGVYPYSVTNALVGCTTSNNATEITPSASYTATITADNNYTLTGATVSVTMGGVDVTSTAYNNGVISIASVSGDLVISVSAVFNIVAYATPQSGVTYTDVSDLSSYSEEMINGLSMAISNCQDITSSTETIYLSNETSISVGATRSYTLSTQEPMTDEIIGFNHDTLTSSTAYGSATATGKAGITWQMVNCLKDRYIFNSNNDMATNAGGWNGSVIRTVTMPQIKATLPQSMQNILKQVDKKAADGGGTNYTQIVTSADYLFLLAEIEIMGTVSYSQNGADEGTLYKLWALNNTSSDRVKYYDNNGTNAATAWWLRSSNTTTAKVVNISTSGNVGTSSSISTTRGTSFAYCT